MFTPVFHELTFLEVPERYYRIMTRASGRPNRVLVDKYHQVLEKSNLQFSIRVTHLAGVGEITPHLRYEEIPEQLRQKSLEYVHSIKPRLTITFRSLPDEVLSVSGLFMIARKL
jgi:hypothetical protein